MGVPGYSASSPESLRPTLEKALEEPGPALVDIRIPQGALVVPMVYPGNSLDEMVTA